MSAGQAAGVAGMLPPLVVLSAGGMLSALPLLPALQKRQLGFVFLYLLVQDLPQLLMHVVI